MDDVQRALLASLAESMAPLAAAARDPKALRDLFEDLGWDTEAQGEFPTSSLSAVVQRCAEAVAALTEVSERVPQSYAELFAAAQKAAALVEAVQQFPATLAGAASSPATAAGLPRDLLALLVVTYLQVRHPVVFRVAQLLGIVGTRGLTPPSGPGRLPDAPPTWGLSLDRIPDLLLQPAATLRDLYAGVGTEGDRASGLAALLFPQLEDLFRSLGGQAVVGLDPAQELRLSGDAAQIAQRLLTVYVPEVPGRAGFSIALESGADGTRVVLVPFGDLSLDLQRGHWTVALRSVVNATVPGLTLGPGGVVPPAGQGTGRIELQLTLTRAASAEAVIFGAASSSRLQTKGVRLTAYSRFSEDAADYGVAVLLEGATFVLAGGDGDGFLQQALPPQLADHFDLELGYDRARGVHLGSSSGLSFRRSVRVTVGSVRLDELLLEARPAPGQLALEIVASITVRLGPITAVVQRVGVAVDLLLRSADDVGRAPMDARVRFKPPRGAALAIDAGMVVGGGYLSFDPEKEQYAGAVQLEIAGALSVTAFGLLTTRMPDGSKGFSLLVLIAVRFSPPVQLGYGFTLNGVGGLLGVNRTVSVDALRAGLRAGTLGSILFPEDPVRNAPQIVSDLQAVFPPAPDRFLFGPMVILGWGTPTLLTLELAVLLELPAPVRLIVLSRMRLVLPDERLPVVRLQLDALGIIDFQRGDLSLDAVLYDSRVAGFAVTGEMALRANWGDSPGFVLAIGGFHPRFPAPAGFPPLQRVAISLATGDNPRLRLEAYLALTTNTVQFGARLDLYARAGPFSIEGYLGFDALIRFSPFGFIVDLVAGIALKFNGRSVLSVTLELTLAGPAPWHARGRASFKILFISASVSFDARFGQEERPPLPDPVQVWPLLLAALRERGAWATGLPRGEHPIVSLRELPAGDETLVHPLAQIQVSQRVVPLGQTITRFGNTTPEGACRFELIVIGPDGMEHRVPDQGPASTVEAVAEAFAPAQFREMSDDERLEAPAFESLPAGVRFTAQGFTCGPAVMERSVTYERQTVLRSEGATPAPGAVPATRAAATAGGRPAHLSAAFMEQVAGTGAAGLAPFAHTGAARYSAPARPFGLKPPAYIAVAGLGATATPLPRLPLPGGADGHTRDGSGALSYTAAAEAVARRLVTHPQERGRLRVAPYLFGGPA